VGEELKDMKVPEESIKDKKLVTESREEVY
jgi:hypothetical protein